MEWGINHEYIGSIIKHTITLSQARKAHVNFMYQGFSICVYNYMPNILEPSKHLYLSEESLS